MTAKYGSEVIIDATVTLERTGTHGQHNTGEEMHGTALASLNGEFASMVATADLD